MTQVFEMFAGKTSAHSERADALRRMHRLLAHAALTMLFASLWGLAAGSGTPALALANLYKLPMVITLAALVALPAVLTTRHLLRVSAAPLDIVAALVTSLFRAGLVLLGFAPLLAVYAYTSQWFSPLLAQVSGGLAVVCAGFSLRAEFMKLEGNRGRLLLLAGVSVVTLCLSLLQLIAIATPILSVPTVFGAGIDGILSR